jgi:hypothetical protein
MSGGLTVGRIYEDTSAKLASHRWYWAINDVHAGPDVMRIAGYAATLSAIYGAFRFMPNLSKDVPSCLVM